MNGTEFPPEILLHICTLSMDLETMMRMRATCRLLNKMVTRYLIDAPMPTAYILPHRSMVSLVTCDVCGSKCGNEKLMRQIMYPFFGDYQRLLLKHCHAPWLCRWNAIRCMLRDLSDKQVLLLQEPLPLADSVQIPRSNGSFSTGTARKDHVMQMQDGTLYVGVDWFENDTAYQKLLPLSTLLPSTFEPKFHTLHQLQIQNKLIRM